jgi:hypothetical protein
MPRKAAVLLLRPIVQTISTAAVTIVPSTNLSPIGGLYANQHWQRSKVFFFGQRSAPPRNSQTRARLLCVVFVSFCLLLIAAVARTYVLSE